MQTAHRVRLLAVERRETPRALDRLPRAPRDGGRGETIGTEETRRRISSSASSDDDGAPRAASVARWLSLTDWRRVDPPTSSPCARSSRRPLEEEERVVVVVVVENVVPDDLLQEDDRERHGVQDDRRGRSRVRDGRESKRRRWRGSRQVRPRVRRAQGGFFVEDGDARRMLAEGTTVACERAIETRREEIDRALRRPARVRREERPRGRRPLRAPLQDPPRWSAFAANAMHAAETVRVRIRDARSNGRLDVDDFFVSDEDEAVALMRNCKKVPGTVRPIVSPTRRRDRRGVQDDTTREKSRDEGADVRRSDTFDDSGGTIVPALARTSMRLDVGRGLGERGPEESSTRPGRTGGTGRGDCSWRCCAMRAYGGLETLRESRKERRRDPRRTTNTVHERFRYRLRTFPELFKHFAG